MSEPIRILYYPGATHHCLCGEFQIGFTEPPTSYIAHRCEHAEWHYDPETLIITYEQFEKTTKLGLFDRVRFSNSTLRSEIRAREKWFNRLPANSALAQTYLPKERYIAYTTPAENDLIFHAGELEQLLREQIKARLEGRE